MDSFTRDRKILNGSNLPAVLVLETWIVLLEIKNMDWWYYAGYFSVMDMDSYT